MNCARGDGDLAAHSQVARHFGAAQIQVAILQAQFFVDLVGDFRVVHGERQHFRHVQHFERRDADFDFAGGNFGIVRAGGALADFAGDADDAFAAQRRGALEKFLRQIRRVKNRLRAAFAVADVNEDEAAKVAAGMNPAGQRDRLPDVRRAQFVAMMRAFHFQNPESRSQPSESRIKVNVDSDRMKGRFQNKSRTKIGAKRPCPTTLLLNP